MIAYIARRLLYMVVMLFAVSIVTFVLIQLPPGDYVSAYAAELQDSHEPVDMVVLDTLRNTYGLDRPYYEQYFKWIGNMFHGSLGMSFRTNRQVTELIRERLPLTLVVSIGTLIFTWLISVPIGVYAATHQYSIGDYAVSFMGFIGMATPNFLLALVLMLFFNNTFNLSIGGLFSAEYQTARWSFGKLIDLLKHLPVPLIVIGTAGTAG